jgi:hypothetical protein
VETGVFLFCSPPNLPLLDLLGGEAVADCGIGARELKRRVDAETAVHDARGEQAEQKEHQRGGRGLANAGRPRAPGAFWWFFFFFFFFFFFLRDFFVRFFFLFFRCWRI